MSFEYFQSHQLIDLIPVIESRNSTNDSGFLVSIGPRTDAALDYFELNDSFIPRLRDMAQTVRSSRWEATLRSGNFGFSFEQATTIARSLLMDIQADIQANSIAVSSSSRESCTDENNFSPVLVSGTGLAFLQCLFAWLFLCTSSFNNEF